MRKVITILYLSLLFALIPVSIVWTQHSFMNGLNPFLGVIITPLTILSAILVYFLLIKIFKKYIRFKPDVLFAIGLFSCLSLILVLQLFYGNSTLDIHLHDTYFVMPNWYPFAFVALAFAFFAATYYWFHKIFKRQMSELLGRIHFWISFLGICFILLPIQYNQLTGMPRRYYGYSDSPDFYAFSSQNTIIAVLAILLIVGQLLFVFNFCYSVFRKTT